jgi:hypothetical protein
LSAGEWHHAVGVYDSALYKLTLYLDGDAGATADFDAGMQYDSPVPVHMGAGAGCGGTPSCTRNYNGMIGDVRVWAIPLTPAEVQMIP